MRGSLFRFVASKPKKRAGLEARLGGRKSPLSFLGRALRGRRDSLNDFQLELFRQTLRPVGREGEVIAR